METVFTKIAIKGDGDKEKVLLHYRDDKAEHVSEIKEPPKESFRAAMAKLDAQVVALCEFPKGYAKEVKAHTVSMSESSAGLMTLVVSAKKTLENGKVLNFNTPAYTQAPDGGDPQIAALPDETVKVIRELIVEAEDYLAGYRKQIEMAFEETDAAETAEEVGAGTGQEPGY